MTSTERLSLPYIVQSQSQKEVTHNDGLNLLDMLVQAVVLEVGLDTPPVSPTLGDCYVVGNSPSGDWTTHAGELCQAITGGWRFVSPFEGLLVYNLSDDLGYRYDGSSWNSEAISELQNLSLLGVNASADATNKLAVASSAVLFNNIGNGVQVKLNKNAAGDSASFLYQTNWSGRAEFGTTGDDDFHIKVSPDGSNWHESLVIDRNTGFLNFQKEIRSWGGGILFNGSGSLLNAYEEGTWTPTLYGATTSGTPTYSAQLGRYVRIGNLVWVNFRLVASLAGADGQLRVGGLPFILSSAAGSGSRTSTAIGFRSGLSLLAGYQDIQGIAYNGTDDIYMQKFSATGATSLLASEIGTLTLYATLTYEV